LLNAEGTPAKRSEADNPRLEKFLGRRRNEVKPTIPDLKSFWDGGETK